MDAHDDPLRSLADRLRPPSQMVFVPSKQAMLAYLEGLNAALGPALEHYGEVRSGDVPEPDPLGTTLADGFHPCVFTSHEPATDYARLAGGYATGETVLTQARDWASGLAMCLQRGYAGVEIDRGGDRSVALGRPAVSRLYALLTIEAFSRLTCLYVLRADGSYYCQPTPHGSRQAFVFDGHEAGQRALGGLAAGGASLDLEEVSTYTFIRRLLEAGIDGLVVNVGLHDERPYDRVDFEHVVTLIEESARAAAPAMESPPGTRPRTSTAPPAVPVRGFDDEAAHRAFTAFRESLEQHRITAWQFAESFAFEMDVHVPVYGEDVEGLAWPQFQTDPEARTQKMCAMFTRVTEVRKALAGVHPNFRRFASIAGVEAFRWVWSAPRTVASIAVDYAQPGAFQFPVAWARRVLFPAAADFDDLSKVPAVPWPHIGKVPGARGLKPQILRTLALGWRSLLSVKEPVTVSFAGRRYVPVFSGQEQFFAFMSGPGTPRVTVDPAGREPPFSRWLTSSGPCDGLLLDPAGGAPLALDHTDVLVISRWATRPSTPPTPGDVLADGARLLSSGAIAPETAGRLAADFSSYWFGVREEPGHGFSVVTHNETSYGLFSSEARAAAYISRAANLVEGEFRPREAIVRWGGDTVFDHALRAFSQAVVDPDRPSSPTGLVLNKVALESALARIDERLEPRVPGFIWGEPGFRDG